ncbi:MAG: hypothetical protein CL666_01280 [Balneola sp.]|nr:hypothetical protein [Balneola sp.]|tara:strand:- start:9126 stop:9584 length:459 start_codon:yes stop_codon:yes gene_type:complete
MKKFFETTIGKIILLAIVVAVWGINVLNFSGMAGEEEAGQSQIYANMMEDEYKLPEFEGYHYSASSRNPFHIPSNFRIQQEKPVEETKAEVYQQPVLILNGVMEGMAILTNQRGQTFFVEERDTFNTILVKKIFRDSVRLVHQGNTFVINLN